MLKVVKPEGTVETGVSPWIIANGDSWTRLIKANGRTVVEPVLNRIDNHPDLLAKPEILELIAKSPEMLVALVNVLLYFSPAQSDFTDQEKLMFAQGKGVLESLGMAGVISNQTESIALEDLNRWGIHNGPWIVGTSCSWRRIIQEDTHVNVLYPSKHPTKQYATLNGSEEDMTLAEKSPEILIALTSALFLMEPDAGSLSGHYAQLYESAWELVWRFAEFEQRDSLDVFRFLH